MTHAAAARGNHHHDLVGALSAAAATITVGASVAVSSLLTDYPALGGQAARYAVAAAVLAGLLRAREGGFRRPSGRDLVYVVALATTGLIGFNLFLLAALETADPAAVGVIVGCAPVLLAVSGPLMAGRRPGGRVLVAAGVVVLGAALVEGGGGATLAGVLFAVGALFGEAAFSLLAAPVLPRLGPLALSTYACVAGSLLLGGGAFLVDGASAMPRPTATEATALLVLAVAVTAGAFVAFYTGVERLGVARAGLFTGLIPIGALLGAAAVDGDAVTPLRVVGVGIVATGVVAGMTGGGSGGRGTGNGGRGARRAARPTQPPFGVPVVGPPQHRLAETPGRDLVAAGDAELGVGAVTAPFDRVLGEEQGGGDPPGTTRGPRHPQVSGPGHRDDAPDPAGDRPRRC